MATPQRPPRYDRPASIVHAIEQVNKDLQPNDRLAKYSKMAESAYGFYRGTNHLFWSDFSNDWRVYRFGNANTRVWLQGDLHVYNFGAYTNDRGKIIYSVNDFDESIVSDYQYDIWRMAVSIELLAHDIGIRNADAAVEAFVNSYLDTLDFCREHKHLQKSDFTAHNTKGPLHKFLKHVEKKSSRDHMLDHWTMIVDGERRFKMDSEKLEAVDEDTRAVILAAIQAYGQTLANTELRQRAGYFKVLDLARRLAAGTGSLGTPRYYVLIDGHSPGLPGDCILDVKRQAKPSAYTYMGDAEREEYDRSVVHEGHRHALAQHVLTRHTDDFLGWMELPDGPYSVRERSFAKEAFPAETLSDSDELAGMAKHWGLELGRVHARANKHYGSYAWCSSLQAEVATLVGGHRDKFTTLVCDIAKTYSDQVHRDHEAFVDALKHT